jgi:transposase IS116/IS110/IS902 family protein
LLHKEIKARPEPLLALLKLFRDDLVVGVECMHCWYWISDLCEEHGINFILVLTILYKVGDIHRFESVQKFASYARLVKCKAESAGKVYGTQGNKIGNAHLKWAFSEAAVLFIRNNDKAKRD